MIEIKGLYKSFDDKTVLSDINASFENGKTNLIIGQSGSGKDIVRKSVTLKSRFPRRVRRCSCGV